MASTTVIKPKGKMKEKSLKEKRSSLFASLINRGGKSWEENTGSGTVKKGFRGKKKGSDNRQKGEK